MNAAVNGDADKHFLMKQMRVASGSKMICAAHDWSVAEILEEFPIPPDT